MSGAQKILGTICSTATVGVGGLRVAWSVRSTPNTALSATECMPRARHTILFWPFFFPALRGQMVLALENDAYAMLLDEMIERSDESTEWTGGGGGGGTR